MSSANGDAYELVTWALRMAGNLRPDEVGHPWPSLTPARGSFSDGAHADHVHLGWD
ncbi:MAG: hypothetical protein M3O70_16105 [Actinomycetota bacterium]|nr:hypothetical protein [Actinomycetota bacterium]